MKSAGTAFNFRGFCEKLVIIGLSCLLPFQLGLIWFSTFKQPVRLPDRVASFVTKQISKEGLHLQARSLWIQPDLDIAADDVSIEFDGISGEMVTAQHLEVGISFLGLLRGYTMPHRLSIQGGQVWCPASLSRLGQKNLLISEIDGDFHREGRWILTPGFILRSGSTMATIEGEVPVTLFDFKNTEAADLAALRAQIGASLRSLEQFIEVTKQAGGASLHLHAEGLPDDGSQITLSGQLGNQKGDSDLGLLQAHEFTFLGKLKLSRSCDLVHWSLTGTSNNLKYKNLQIENLSLELNGAQDWMPTHGQIVGSNASLPELPNLQLSIDLASAAAANEPARLAVRYQIHSPDSFIDGKILEMPKGWNNEKGLGELVCRIDYAQLSTAELKKVPFLQAALTNSQVACNGVIGLRDATFYFNNELKRGSGWISFSGLETRGLSAARISRQENSPLLAFVDYHQERQPYALQVRELQLATIQGELDWALTPAAPFSLRLRGDLLPGSLNEILGSWWTDLWSRLQTPGALTTTIDVSGQLQPPQFTVSGVVHLAEFDFQKIPFQSGDIKINSEASGIQIGLQRLKGRGTEDAGSLDGSLTWNNKTVASESGPFVELNGNLAPWILAKVVSEELSTKLKGLQLPDSRQITVRAKPGPKELEVEAEVSCITDFTTFGIPSRNLLCKIQNKNGATTIRTTLGIAEGLGSLSLLGEPEHDSKISIALKDCDSNLIARGLGYTKIPAPKKGTPKEATRFNFNLDGTINLQSPELIRCLGSFEIANPEIKKIRILGGLSTVLEAIGIGATTYELTQMTGQFGCINGRAYFPDILISGPQSKLTLAGEVDLASSSVDFAGVFNIPQKENSFIPNPFNLNRTIADNTRISIKGPISDLKTSATPSVFFLHKLFKRIGLGKIPSELTE
jgi:hypothetical protein